MWFEKFLNLLIIIIIIIIIVFLCWVLCFCCLVCVFVFVCLFVCFLGGGFFCCVYFSFRFFLCVSFSILRFWRVKSFLICVCSYQQSWLQNCWGVTISGIIGCGLGTSGWHLMRSSHGTNKPGSCPPSLALILIKLYDCITKSLIMPVLQQGATKNIRLLQISADHQAM